jgi:hypothetical protein
MPIVGVWAKACLWLLFGLLPLTSQLTPSLPELQLQLQRSFLSLRATYALLEEGWPLIHACTQQRMLSVTRASSLPPLCPSRHYATTAMEYWHTPSRLLRCDTACSCCTCILVATPPAAAHRHLVASERASERALDSSMACGLPATLACIMLACSVCHSGGFWSGQPCAAQRCGLSCGCCSWATWRDGDAWGG